MISEKSAYACIRTHASPRGAHQYNSNTSRLPEVPPGSTSSAIVWSIKKASIELA